MLLAPASGTCGQPGAAARAGWIPSDSDAQLSVKLGAAKLRLANLHCLSNTLGHC